MKPQTQLDSAKFSTGKSWWSPKHKPREFSPSSRS